MKSPFKARERWTYDEILAWHRRQAADPSVHASIRKNHEESIRWYLAHPPARHHYKKDDPMCPVNAIKRPGDGYDQ